MLRSLSRTGGSPKRQLQLCRIHKALRRCLDVAKARLLIQALRIENLQDADIALVVALTSEFQVGFGCGPGTCQHVERFGIVIEGLQRVGNLAERRQDRLLIVRGAGAQRIDGGTLLGAQRAAVEQRRNQPRSKTPYVARAVEEVR